MFSFEDLIKCKNGPLVMGILNVTPDSFSDGGEAFNVDNIVKKVNVLCSEGADIIDVGACSTAPGNDLVSETEEIKRLKLFLPEILKTSTVPVSVDTFRPAVAEYALNTGVSMINDESGVFNAAMAELVASYGCGWIFMHNGGMSSSEVCEYSDGVTSAVCNFFKIMKNKAVGYGLSEQQLCYDCGIGFGKTRQDDLTLLNSCDVLSEFSPLLIGVSRKRIIGEITGVKNPRERVAGSIVAGVMVADKGAKILRVHDVKETVEALSVLSALKKGVL
ncbi:MAG: dihydropteroate synthase [Clostridia bacterium]|nr:dihydropteroate synthase [Clostridia bacterium]